MGNPAPILFFQVKRPCFIKIPPFQILEQTLLLDILLFKISSAIWDVGQFCYCDSALIV